EPKRPPAIVEFFLDAEFTKKLDYFPQQKAKVTQVTTGKEVIRNMRKSPAWSLPKDAKIYVRSEVPTESVGGKPVEFLFDWSGFIRGTKPAPITKPGDLVANDGKKSTYKAVLSLPDDKLPSGEVVLIGSLSVKGGAKLASGETVYDTREMGFISGSADRDANAKQIFDTVKAALTAQYAITFDYTAAQYNGGDPKNNKNHLTDDLEFDTADFSWMLMH